MRALIIVDIQNDFCPGGLLAVEEGDTVIPIINSIADKFDVVVQTQDWHPENHSSFASSYPDKNEYEVIQLAYGKQVLWPDHCVQNTSGADFHTELEMKHTQLIIRKGFNPKIDSYSAFFENDQVTTTGLSGYLKDKGVTDVYICGLATDFCVKWSALDGVKEGFDIKVIADACRGIDLNDSVNLAWEEMKNAGVKVIESAAI